MFYRPLSMSLTWELGYSLFGTNALPYHVVSLALHGLAAWLLGRAVATISGEPGTGWIAGALFAVYPLCTEPVAWLASQWDEWAAVCTLGAVWAFAYAWKTGNRRAYLVGLAAATLGVMMKESALPLPLVLPFVALATEVSSRRDETTAPAALPDRRSLALRVLVWSLPFAIPAILFAGLRISGGGIGGYVNAPTAWQQFFWDAILTAGLQMLMPLNRSVFDPIIVQIAGLVVTVSFLAGMALWAGRRRHLALLSIAWFFAFIVPVANLVIPGSRQSSGNRLLYFSFMGFCMGGAVILAGLLDAASRRRVARVCLAAALVVTVTATWFQLQPTTQASRQSRHIVEEMGRLIVPLPNRLVTLNIRDLPHDYQGSYVLLNGLDAAMALFNHQPSKVVEVQQLDPHQPSIPYTHTAGIYNLAFSLDQQEQLYYVSEIAGTSVAAPAPAGSGQAWDYTRCRAGSLPGWQANQASFECNNASQAPPSPDTSYATFNPLSSDGKLIGAGIKLDLAGARWLRLSVLARLPAKQRGRTGEWFWTADGETTWNQQHSYAFDLDSTGAWRVYWSYLPVANVGKQLTGLRFDPVNDKLAVDVQWVALDLVK